MAEQRKQYTRDFKLEAIRLLDESGRSKAQITRELGVHESMFKRWKAQVEERPRAEAFPGNGNISAAEEEVRRLRRENEQLRQERDFLRKTAA
jgi:transposase